LIATIFNYLVNVLEEVSIREAQGAIKLPQRVKLEAIMSKLTQGSVVVSLPSHLEVLPEAGKLTPDQVSAIEKPRRGIGLTCEQTAAAMTKDPSRLSVPGVTPEQLIDYGKQAEDIDAVILDLEVLLGLLRQNNLLLDARAHRALRQVLSAVRAQEKFDPKLASLVPHLISYFSKSKPEEKPTETPAT
jgi:hypothetical protein